MTQAPRQSRIGRMQVEIPDGVEVRTDGQQFHVKGAKGELSMNIAQGIQVEQVDGALQFSVSESGVEARALHGTMRSLAQNMIVGVTSGYERRLELIGVGYRVNVSGRNVNLALGFSHPIVYALPDGIEAKVEEQTVLLLSGSDKQQLGQVAAEIRAFRPPEPYKGKGVRYVGEHVRRKEAKKK